MRRSALLVVRCIVAAAGLAAPAFARAVQAQTPVFVDVGSELDRYDRLLQITGHASSYPVTARGLVPAAVATRSVGTAGDPWSGGADRQVRTGSLGAVHWAVLPMQAGVYFNSAFAYGFNDGPLWQGRGVTGALQGGIAGQWGRLTFQLEPMVFDAQNAPFTLKPTGQPGNRAFSNAFYPDDIDDPQRFGPHQYRRIDPGQSTIRLDLWPIAVGFSTANEFWGPAIDSPLILGDNAAGFPRFFVGTAKPWHVWIGSVYGRLIYGRLEQSAYAPPANFGASRLGSGLVGVFVPRGVPGLELGATRFFHSSWPADGLSLADLERPFQGLLKESQRTAANPTGDDRHDNQLASVFFRWSLPRSGAEVYGEYGREDHNWDNRDFWEQLDHSAAYTIGVQRVWQRSASRWYVAHIEILNSRISHLQEALQQTPWYLHSPLNQGHTYLGQVLGAPGGVGGGAATLQVDRLDPSGRWSLTVGRLMRAENRISGAAVQADSADVMQSIGVERLIHGPRADFTFGLTQVWDVNRDFRGNQNNLNVRVGVLARW
jgi:hypothetical protein